MYIMYDWSSCRVNTKNIKVYVPIVTVSTKVTIYLRKHLSDGLKRSIYWNNYLSYVFTQSKEDNNPVIIKLDAGFQEAKRLFVLALNDTDCDSNKIEINSHKRYFLPREEINNYSMLIDGRNVHEQPINESVKKYVETRKTTFEITSQQDVY